MQSNAIRISQSDRNNVLVQPITKMCDEEGEGLRPARRLWLRFHTVLALLASWLNNFLTSRLSFPSVGFSADRNGIYAFCDTALHPWIVCVFAPTILTYSQLICRWDTDLLPLFPTCALTATCALPLLRMFHETLDIFCGWGPGRAAT